MQMKDFKVAQIVPVSCLNDIKFNHYHMCLAHLAVQNGEYAGFYRTMSELGKFVLMDNGAAENAQLDTGTLLEAYKLVKPTEIVIPDTLCDKDSTLEKADAFISQHGDLPYRFMAVPQGKDISEWCKCASELLFRYPRINTIGVSKFLNIATKNPNARFTAACYLYEVSQRMGRKIEVHLLGCDEGPSIVREIQMEVPIVRGCDSAFAYIAAKGGVEIVPEMKRPKGEIDFLHGERPDNLKTCLRRFEFIAGAYDQADNTHWLEVRHG